MTQPATDAKALVPRLTECGYSSSQIAESFRIDQNVIDVAAFAGKPWDNWSACLAAVNLNGDSKGSAAKAKSLGATSVFVCGPQGIDWWGMGAQGPTGSRPIRWPDLSGFFREHKAELAPQTIYDAKLGRQPANRGQMTFFDVGLMPAVEKERGETLLRLVRSEIENFHDDLGDRIKSEQDWEHVYRAVFWLLTAKVLNDKEVPNFINVHRADVKDAFASIGRHHGVTDSLPPFGAKGLAAMGQVWARLLNCGSLADVSSEAIAYLYEHALIDKAVQEGKTDPDAKPMSVRKRRGVHGTPSVLRDHMLSQLWPLIEDIDPANRNVLEPACGHAPFLTGMMRWLREWNASGEPVNSHKLMRDRLVGLDNWSFARELAKLNLTVADAEHKNSWQIIDGDMFAPGVLRGYAERAHILLSNPPYESFVKVGAKRYLNTDEPVTAETQGVEMLKRTVPHLPPGGVFGVVMPVGMLHDKESKDIRKLLLKDFDLSEISVFADNLFEHGDHEVAVLMGRKKKPRSTSPILMYRRVREGGMAAFKERLEFTWEREVLPSRFAQSDDADMRVPELDDVWLHLSAGPTLNDNATVAKGLDFKGETLPAGCWTIRAESAQSGVLGYANVDEDLQIYSLPKAVRLNTDPRAVLSFRAGKATGRPQVLLNYAPVARKPWKLKATLDENGYALTSRFSAIRPRDGGPSALYLWALLNSPVANGFAYDKLGKRDILVGTMRTLPVPPRSPSHEAAIEQAATKYRTLAIAKAAAKPAPSGLFNQKMSPTAPPPTNTEVQAALLAMDAAVLRAYNLPVRLERQLLDLFNGVERKGVGCSFTSYPSVPDSAHLPFHLRIHLPRFHELIALRLAGTISAAQQAELKAIETSLDEYERQSPNALAFRQWLQDLDRRQDRALTLGCNRSITCKKRWRHWSVKVTRRNNVPTYSDYTKYKRLLREDFGYRCCYCGSHESVFGALRNMTIDHFRPKSRFPHLAVEYTNLYYCCGECNTYKGDRWPSEAELAADLRFVDVCAEELFDHISFDESGIVPLTAPGRFTVETLRLQRPELSHRNREIAVRYERFCNQLARAEGLLDRINIQSDLANFHDLIELRDGLLTDLQELLSPPPLAA